MQIQDTEAVEKVDEEEEEEKNDDDSQDMFGETQDSNKNAAPFRFDEYIQLSAQRETTLLSSV